ncbi:type I-D CRISPR-associated protein Cas10d/Csc3 [Cyanobacterium aponinum FACHB-4101]|uniref:type I-D CRISPR-associated protein Cas10d/Csc3 n=1 Tax=Cyanobacterium aponinum TaxID=379064 RepID=UPI001680024E|nr:type I-D CRISPR-associated protein Cas10d/Csc3 [Cyanobacterium aponinum]MBD2392679.1 type I-D CRISPR-associated protein Cas10d/Csc3 [Cyanobacterium aponinum FACHB-4101]
MNINQLSLFDNSEQNQNDDLPSYSLDLDSLDNEQDVDNQRELLTSILFKNAIKETNQNDSILNDFAEYILPNILTKLAGITAKGGQFTEDRKAEGKNTEKSKHDQSLISHILNGLFPTYRIINLLLLNQLETNPIKRYFNELIIKLFLASFPLHDFEKDPDFQKYLSEVVSEFKDRNWSKNPPNKQEAPNLSRDYVKKRMEDLGIDLFLGENWQNYIDDIVWLSHNAGDGSDADRGLESRGLKPTLNGRVRQHLHQLLKLSDLFVSIIKHPKDIENSKFAEILGNLSDNQLQFTYHGLSDNRGVITNIINNALITAHGENYQPLLYLPDGVVYVSKIDVPEININHIADTVISRIFSLCRKQIQKRFVGVSRDDRKRRIKLAPYIKILFTQQEIIEILAPKLVFRFTQNLEKLGEILAEKQRKKQAPLSVDFSQIVFDDKVDRLGKFLALISSIICDKEKNLHYDILKNLGISEFTEDFESFTDSGGTIYRYFYIASRFYEKKIGISSEEEITILEELGLLLAKNLTHRLKEKSTNVWDDLKSYVNEIIFLQNGKVNPPNPESFLTEIDRYHKAKIMGRQRENVCAMSSSSYTINEQMESGSLSAPQVYSNRQILFNTQAAKRQICSIWATEIMLRQILMNNTNAIGADFENRKYRYLYLYPAYFFTPETSLFLRKAYDGLEKTRFDAELRKHFITEKQEANLTIENYQQVDDLLIKPDLKPEDDHTFKLNYSTDDPITFFFVALPPGRDATDTESWVMPTWLALVLPLVADVKVVVSESPVPPFISGADFEETVLLDGTHQAIKSLVKCDRHRLDLILPRNQQKFSPLNALTCAYAINLEVNRKKDGNPDWGKLSDLARDIKTNPLYVFHYLSKWLRKQTKFDVVPTNKIKLYRQFYYYFDQQGEIMTKLEKLTNLYRKFYQAKSRYAKANAILKPIDNIAETILKADKSWPTEELVNITTGNLATLMNNVGRRTAEGRPTFVKVDGKWKRALTNEQERQAIREFADFFIKEIYIAQFNEDKSRLAGKQLNLIRNTCEYLYRLADDEKTQQNQEDEPDELVELQTEEV